MKKKPSLILILFISLVAAILIISYLHRSVYHQGPSSDHFNGKRFFNKEPDNSFFDHLKWLWEMETIEWPDWVDDPPQPTPIANVKEGELRITYINHATTLIQMGLRICVLVAVLC